MMRCQILWIVTFSLGALQGCVGVGKCSHYEVSIKNAYIMYGEQKQQLGPPSPKWYQLIDSEFGRQQFVDDLSHYLKTKYRIEVIYALGWFGTDSHIGLIAEALNDPEPEVRRVALAAINHITNHNFTNSYEAFAWWETVFPNIPRPAVITSQPTSRAAR